MDKLGQVFDLFKSAKAYVATLVALGGILLTLSADKNFQSLGIPETFVGKMAGIGTLLVAFGGVFGVRNLRTAAQAKQDLARAQGPAPRRVRRRAKPKAAKKAVPPEQ